MQNRGVCLVARCEPMDFSAADKLRREGSVAQSPVLTGLFSSASAPIRCCHVHIQWIGSGVATLVNKEPINRLTPEIEAREGRKATRPKLARITCNPAEDPWKRRSPQPPTPRSFGAPLAA